MHQKPVIAVIIMASCQRVFSSPAERGMTTAAITAQVAASGPVINWREVPNKAYMIMGKIQAYNPTMALIPSNSV